MTPSPLPEDPATIHQDHQHHTIWTPEMVALQIPLAGLSRRFLARLIDEFIVWAFIFGIWILAFYLLIGSSVAFKSTSFDKLLDHYGFWILLAIVLVTLGLKFAYFTLLHAYNRGQTLGKMVVSIRLTTDRIGHPNLWTCTIRSLVDFIDMALFYGTFSMVLMLMHPQEKRLADLASGTLVILNE